jgi:hypothetical protein
MRYFVIETVDFDTGEIDVLAEMRGVPQPTLLGDTEWSPAVSQDTSEYLTLEEFLSRPGGEDALERFRAQDDASYDARCRAEAEAEAGKWHEYQGLTDAARAERIRNSDTFDDAVGSFGMPEDALVAFAVDADKRWAASMWDRAVEIRRKLHPGDGFSELASP